MAHDADEAILYAIEKALDQHTGLVRKGPASLVFTRHAPRYTVTVNARARGSRKKDVPIHGSGDTAEDAAEELIEQLDIWAEALK